MMPLFSQIAALQDLILGPTPHPREPEPAMVWCSHCGGSGSTHSAYADNTCNACDGVGKRRADWRERMAQQEQMDE